MIEITAGKQPLQVVNPVIGAAGIFGFSGEYARLIDLSKLGAIVTNPVTWKPRRAASGTRVVSLDSGVLVHTGLPNPGMHSVYRNYAAKWQNSAAPIIVHVVATSPDEVGKCVQVLDMNDGIVGVEIGLSDQATHRDARLMIGAARQNPPLPLMARLPLYYAAHVAAASEEAGADALVVAAPPRGTARDPLTGQLVGGRVYGPWLKALGLRAVGQIVQHVKIPVIGCGGSHNPNRSGGYLGGLGVLGAVELLRFGGARIAGNSVHA